LALFGFLLSVPLLGGIGNTPAIVALTLYSLLPIIRNTYTGIIGVEPAVREAGKGMGMTDRQLLLQVELPLAMSVILAGVRVAMVIAIGVATITPAIGAGILAGAVPAALLALVADMAIGWLEHRITVKR
jgi:osmoprotectant transport system permease protein